MFSIEKEISRLRKELRDHPIIFEGENPPEGQRRMPASSGEDEKLFQLWLRLLRIHKALSSIKNPILTQHDVNRIENRIKKLSSDYILWKFES